MFLSQVKELPHQWTVAHIYTVTWLSESVLGWIKMWCLIEPWVHFDTWSNTSFVSSPAQSEQWLMLSLFSIMVLFGENLKCTYLKRWQTFEISMDYVTGNGLRGNKNFAKVYCCGISRKRHVIAAESVKEDMLLQKN